MSKITHFFIFLVKWFLIGFFLILLFNGIVLKPVLSSSLGLYWDADVFMRRAKIDWSLPGLVLEEVRVGNPYGFPRGDMLEIERVALSFSKKESFWREGALTPGLLDIRIRKIDLMRRVSGHLNLWLLVHPETARNKTRGLTLSPVETHIGVGEIHETDATAPILTRQTYVISNKEFSISQKSNFGVIAQIFMKQLFQRIGLNEEGNQTALPAPQYHGIASSVEQEIRENAEKKAKQEAAAAEFEALSAEADIASGQAQRSLPN